MKPAKGALELALASKNVSWPLERPSAQEFVAAIVAKGLAARGPALLTSDANMGRNKNSQSAAVKNGQAVGCALPNNGCT